MKKHIRCAASWTCYVLGDAVCRISRVLPEWQIFGFLYQPYNRLMIWSGELDTGDCGIWRDASSVE